MAAYVVLRLTVTDEEGFGGYVAKAEPTLEASGGEFVFRGKVSDELEGDNDHPLTAVLKFQSRESALAWYNSAEYQEAIGVRQAASDAVVVIYEAP